MAAVPVPSEPQNAATLRRFEVSRSLPVEGEEDDPRAAGAGPRDLDGGEREAVG